MITGTCMSCIDKPLSVRGGTLSLRIFSLSFFFSFFSSSRKVLAFFRILVCNNEKTDWQCHVQVEVEFTQYPIRFFVQNEFA